MIAFKQPQIILTIIPLAIILLIVMWRNFVKFEDYREEEYFQRSRKGQRIMMYFTRLAIFSLLIIALAEPFELRQETIPGSPSLSIYTDRSASFTLFDTNISDRLSSEISKTMPVNLRSIAEENRSAIGDSILANMQGDENILLITDGNNNYGRTLGDMMLFAASLNTTINAVQIEPIKNDALVTINGPSETTADTENNFEAKVVQSGTLPGYSLKITIDDEPAKTQFLSGEKTVQFSKKLKEGYHTVTAEIDSKDHFPQNNKFMKTVKVQPKPKILFVTNKNSPAKKIFTSIYDVSETASIPDDIGGYSAIIINDIRAESLPMDKLTSYVLDGNGLFVIGGKNSFDRDNYKINGYKTYEALLPVTVGTGKEEPKKEVNVVLLIDISGSTGSTFNTGSKNAVQEVEKALAVSILGDMKENDNIGVVAFESAPHTVSELGKLIDSPGLSDKIARLSYGRGTDIAAGITAARNMLSNAHGSKSIILISDGLTGGSPSEDIREARISSSAGIKVFTVGVGERTDTEHMKDIAASGRGSYFEPKETDRIKIILGESEQSNDSYSLETMNNYHFITKNLILKASVSGHNFVLPKSQSQMLVTTATNEPILTAWRFGLGRIAVLSTDDGSAWNGEMLGKENSALITRTTNWAIGDLSRNKAFDVQMSDIYLGETMEINVITKATPNSPGLNFTKTGEKLYTAEYQPQEPGFYRFFDAVAAVNYNKEFSQTGMNPALSQMVMATNGAFFNPDEIQEIINKVKEDSKRTKTETQSYSWLFALAALAIFLLEIAIRRAIETKRINKQVG